MSEQGRDNNASNATPCGSDSKSSSSSTTTISSTSTSSSLTPEQLARIERNKQQALQRLKQRHAEAEAEATPESEQHPAKRAKAEGSDRKGDEVCAVCKTSAQLDPLMREHFSELVCFHCKDGRDEYDLMCKADVMAEYLLPEGTIRVLSFVEKENPKKEGWTKMKLFLRKHAIERALQRWGSMGELAAEKKRRQAAKYARAAKKVKNVLQSSSLQQL